MHRTNRVRHALIGGFLLLGLLSGGGNASAQKVEVPPPPRPADRPTTLTVTVNSTARLQMRGKQVIENVVNEREAIARVAPIIDDPTTVQITGVQPGTTVITLTSRADPPARPVVERVEVIVEIDVTLLRNLIQRAVPTAAVTPIPAGTTIILSGTVLRAEDIDTIVRIAQSAIGPGAQPPINAMRIGGVQMVQLDVVIARVSRSELRRMALGDYGDAGQNHYLSQGTASLFGVQQATLQGGNAATGAASGAAGAASSAGQLTVNGLMGTPNGAAPNIVLALFNSNQSVLLFLQALRDNNLAKLLAEPHLISMSGRPAFFNSGGQQAVPTVSGFGGTAGVQFYEFGTTLTFLPIVMGDGRIYLEVNPNITALDPAAGVVIPGGGLVPGRLQQAVRTSVMMEDGQTFCIGGLIQSNVRASTTKLPILGDIPFLGAFFSRKEYNEIEEELVVLVTPHLIDAMDCAQVPKLLPGQETRSPDDFELFLEGILEAPRGQRQVNHGRRYVPAWKGHPTAQCYPCLGGGPGKGAPCDFVPQPYGCGIQGNWGPNGGCGPHGCGVNGCGPNGCGPQGVPTPVGPGEIGTIQPVGGSLPGQTPGGEPSPAPVAPGLPN